MYFVCDTFSGDPNLKHSDTWKITIKLTLSYFLNNHKADSISGYQIDWYFTLLQKMSIQLTFESVYLPSVFAKYDDTLGIYSQKPAIQWFQIVDIYSQEALQWFYIGNWVASWRLRFFSFHLRCCSTCAVLLAHASSAVCLCVCVHVRKWVYVSVCMCKWAWRAWVCVCVRGASYCSTTHLRLCVCTCVCVQVCVFLSVSMSEWVGRAWVCVCVWGAPCCSPTHLCLNVCMCANVCMCQFVCVWVSGACMSMRTCAVCAVRCVAHRRVFGCVCVCV